MAQRTAYEILHAGRRRGIIYDRYPDINTIKRLFEETGRKDNSFYNLLKIYSSDPRNPDNGMSAIRSALRENPNIDSKSLEEIVSKAGSGMPAHDIAAIHQFYTKTWPVFTGQNRKRFLALLGSGLFSAISSVLFGFFGSTFFKAEVLPDTPGIPRTYTPAETGTSVTPQGSVPGAASPQGVAPTRGLTPQEVSLLNRDVIPNTATPATPQTPGVPATTGNSNLSAGNNLPNNASTGTNTTSTASSADTQSADAGLDTSRTLFLVFAIVAALIAVTLLIYIQRHKQEKLEKDAIPNVPNVPLDVSLLNNDFFTAVWNLYYHGVPGKEQTPIQRFGDMIQIIYDNISIIPEDQKERISNFINKVGVQLQFINADEKVDITDEDDLQELIKLIQNAELNTKNEKKEQDVHDQHKTDILRINNSEPKEETIPKMNPFGTNDLFNSNILKLNLGEKTQYPKGQQTQNEPILGKF